MNAIDELLGKALAEAVAQELGMVQDPAHPQWWGTQNGEGRGWYIEDGPAVWIPATGKTLTFRPDRNIDQAWVLDGKGWSWDFSEDIPEDGWLEIVITEVPDIEEYPVIIRLNMADFPTKDAAYATARCRAYLKARGWDRMIRRGKTMSSREYCPYCDTPYGDDMDAEGRHFCECAGAEVVRLRAQVVQLQTALSECRDCLRDVASGAGGWAWEEVLDSADAAIDAAKEVTR